MLKKVLVVLVLVLFLSSVTFAANQDSQTIEDYKDSIREGRKEMIEEAKENREELKEEVKERICERLEKKIDLKLARFDKNKGVHVAKYQRLKEKLERVLDKLEDKGFDVSQLEDHLPALDDLIKQYAKAYSDFIESLRFTKGYACGKSEGDFRDSLGGAREMLAKVKELRKEIRDYYKDVIREDIKDLREQASELYEAEEEGSVED